MARRACTTCGVGPLRAGVSPRTVNLGCEGSAMKPMALMACAGVAVSLAGVARGQTINWAAAVSGDWGVVGNWSPMNVPDNSGEDAVLGLTGPYTVSFTGTSYNVRAYQATNALAELR